MLAVSFQLLDDIETFLEKEKEEYLKEQQFKDFYSIYISERKKVDDLFYSFFRKEGLDIEEGSWVEVKSDNMSMFASLWFSEKKGFYLITEEPIPFNNVKIAEADALQLVLMQEKALKFFRESEAGSSIVLRNIICNLSRYSVRAPKEFYFLNAHLNDSQKRAVQNAVNLSQNDPFYLIHGPPGTGKTTVITEIVRQLNRFGKKVLITSHTNVAVDNVMENIFPDLGSVSVRLGLRSKVTPQLRKLVPTKDEEILHLKVDKIVGATLSKVSMLVMTGKINWENPFFDYVIIDESSMATIPLTLVGLLCGKMFILVGDQKQLPPITKTESNDLQRYIRDKRAYESLFGLLIETHPQKSTMLDVQYRSHPDIIEFSSKQFYEGRIKSDRQCHQRILQLERRIQNEKIPGILNTKPLVCIDSSRFNPEGWIQKSHFGEYSFFNEYEAAIALAVRDDLLRSGIKKGQISIITPFSIQRQVIRNAVRKKYGQNEEDDVLSIEDLTAATVDSFQGKERDCIIFCITWVHRNKKQGLPKALKDWRKLNVALTRPKKKMIIVGAISEFTEFPYSALHYFLKDKGSIVRAPK